MVWPLVVTTFALCSLRHSESVGGKFFVHFFQLLVSESLCLSNDLLLLQLVEFIALSLSLLLQGLDDVSSGPSDLVGEVSEQTSVSVGFDSENLESLWHNHALLLVIWEWDTLEDLKALESGFTSGGLVREHSTKRSPEHAGWSSEVLELPSWVGIDSLSKELMIVEVISEERTRKNKLLTPDDDNSLSLEELLGDLGSESSDQVASTVYDNLLFEHT